MDSMLNSWVFLGSVNIRNPMEGLVRERVERLPGNIRVENSSESKGLIPGWFKKSK